MAFMEVVLFPLYHHYQFIHYQPHGRTGEKGIDRALSNKGDYKYLAVVWCGLVLVLR